MKQQDFSLALNALLPGCDPNAAAKWSEFAAECVDREQYAHFIPAEHDAAVENWLDATYAGLYAVKQEHGPEIAAKVAGLSCQQCALYPDEMMQAAEILKEGGDAQRIGSIMFDNELDGGELSFFDLPDGAALTAQGPEISIARSGAPYGMTGNRTESDYLLADGTALLESERDGFGRYRAIVGADGTVSQTERLYAPVLDAEGAIRAFQEVKSVTARDREIAFLTGQDDTLAIYRMKVATPPEEYVPLARLQQSGGSPLAGNYDRIHSAKIEPGADQGKVLDTYRTTHGALKPGDIVAFKQTGTVTCWYVDELAYSKMPGLLDNCLESPENQKERAELANERNTMMLVNLRHMGKSMGIRFPATMDEVNRAIVELKRPYDAPSRVKITDTDCPVENLTQYIKCADPENEADVLKLNQLAAKIDGMRLRELYTFSGALDAEKPNGLDDVLRIADSLDQYELIGEVSTDRELGNWLVEHGCLDVNFPEAVRPYLDYVAIGAEYYANHGGVYTMHGYVKRREPSQVQAAEHRPALITLHLLTQRMTEPYRLQLPATDEELDKAKAEIEIDEFAEATVVKIEFAEPYMDELIPQSCLCVEDANELAVSLAEMQKQDGELLKYLAVLSVLQPENLTDALHLAMDLDDYESVTNDTNEYGKQVLRRIGADDKILDAIEGYMDFEKLGDDSMVEDGVRQTEFGLIRRCSRSFPEEAQGQQMSGMA